MGKGERRRIEGWKGKILVSLKVNRILVKDNFIIINFCHFFNSLFFLIREIINLIFILNNHIKKNIKGI